MIKHFLKNGGGFKRKKIYKILSLLLFLVGLVIIIYVFFPLVSWAVYFAPSFSQQNIVAPIPKNRVVSDSSIESLFKDATNSLNVDYTNASNWFPNYKFQKAGDIKIQQYLISIPKLNIKNAIVATNDTDLSKHLVNYFGTSFPPEKGNAVIFGHSTLPQLYDEKNYKTIFTYLYKLVPGDEIIVNSGNGVYKYKVENVIVVDPDNTTVLEQNYDDSFLTLITCTPPGTIWKRLVVKGRIEKI